jgi:hypothetical protein
VPHFGLSRVAFRGEMQTLADGTIRVTWTDLGRPEGKGYTALPSGGQLLLDDADMNYASQYLAAGYEPAFFVRLSDALQGRYIVVSRVRA